MRHIQIVKFLFTGDAQRHDFGPHAAHEVQTDSTTGVAGRVKLGMRPDADVAETSLARHSGRWRPMNGSAPTAWKAVMKISSSRFQTGLAG